MLTILNSQFNIKNVYILDIEKVKSAIKTRGFRSSTQLADELNIHRNTLHQYLNGKSVLPKQLQRILMALNLEPKEVIVPEKVAPDFNETFLAQKLERAQLDYPQMAFVLFGSRARSTHSKYSDFDIGIYSSKGVLHSHYLKVRRQLIELFDPTPYNVDVVNLHNADQDFLESISPDWKFLGGSLASWVQLKQFKDARE